MNTDAPLLLRYCQPGLGARLGLQRGDTVHDISHRFSTLAQVLRESSGGVAATIAALQRAADESGQRFAASALDNPPAPNLAHCLPPLDAQEVWAAGVTYTRSREARQEESEDGGDVYARVYDAPRPEIFFKATAKNTVGSHAAVGIRRDSRWNVPEAELALVLNPSLELLGFTIGNDMSSRDIEGANPLYLPQAKVYSASCALGPGILLAPTAQWPPLSIHLEIERAGRQLFRGSVRAAQIKRSIAELLDYLGRSNHFPQGVILLTGTGIVPPPDFTLAPGDRVCIEIDGIGSLHNDVVPV